MKSKLNKKSSFRNAVDVAIFNTKRQILLGKRNTLIGYGTWAFPGGRINPGEKILQAAKRELEEELGKFVKINITKKVVSVRENSLPPDYIPHLTIILFGKYISGEILVMEKDKCKTWVWFDVNKLPDKCFSGIKESIQQYINKEVFLIPDYP